MNILEATRGNATVLGMDSRSISLRDLSRIGYVSENQDMPQALTVAEYLDHLRLSIQGVQICLPMPRRSRLGVVIAAFF